MHLSERKGQFTDVLVAAGFHCRTLLFSDLDLASFVRVLASSMSFFKAIRPHNPTSVGSIISQRALRPLRVREFRSDARLAPGGGLAGNPLLSGISALFAVFLRLCGSGC